MKKISTIIFILVFSVFVFSQDAQPVSNWQEFSPDGEEFSVKLPKKVIESVNLREIEKQKFDVISTNYRTYSNGVFYFIFSKKLPLNRNISTNPNLTELLSAFIKKFDDESEEISFGELKGIKYEFTDSEDFYHNIILVNTNTYSYRFHIIAEEKDNNDVSHFLNSLKFNNSIKPRTPEHKSGIISIDSRHKFNFSEGETFKIESDKNQSNSVPLKITHKPRANYTELARSYGLNGTVVFKATFSSNGEMENIIPLKRMPFGLTDSVREAIKGVKFEPAMKEGVPQSATRIFNYLFLTF